MNTIKKVQSLIVKFGKWFDRKFGWFFTNGYKAVVMDQQR
jgi:hypothetical protein